MFYILFHDTLVAWHNFHLEKTLPPGPPGFSRTVSDPDLTPLNTDGATFPMRSAEKGGDQQTVSSLMYDDNISKRPNHTSVCTSTSDSFRFVVDSLTTCFYKARHV